MMRLVTAAEQVAYRTAASTQLYRGVNLDTTHPGMERVHEILSGGDWDHPELAGHILDHLSKRGLGGHWSTDPTIAEKFARWPNEQTGRGGNLQAVVSADWNGQGADPNRTNTREFNDAGEQIRAFPWEKEHTLLPGTNLNVNGVKIRPYDDEYWNGPADPDQEIDENHEGPWHELSLQPSSRLAAEYDEYAGHHQAPGPGTGFPIHDMTGDDYGGGLGGVDEHWYTHPEWFNSGETSKQDTKATQQMYNRVRGQPEAPVDIYRALPHGNTRFNTGDWVTPSLEYARQHAMHATDPEQDLPVIKSTVPAKHLWQNADSYYEMGYHGPSHEGQVVK